MTKKEVLDELYKRLDEAGQLVRYGMSEKIRNFAEGSYHELTAIIILVAKLGERYDI